MNAIPTWVLVAALVYFGGICLFMALHCKGETTMGDETQKVREALAALGRAAVLIDRAINLLQDTEYDEELSDVQIARDTVALAYRDLDARL